MLLYIVALVQSMGGWLVDSLDCSPTSWVWKSEVGIHILCINRSKTGIIKWDPFWGGWKKQQIYGNFEKNIPWIVSPSALFGLVNTMTLVNQPQPHTATNEPLTDWLTNEFLKLELFCAAEHHQSSAHSHLRRSIWPTKSCCEWWWFRWSVVVGSLWGQGHMKSSIILQIFT